jgi:N-sulfoglucosamine sulfohydrolase
MKPNILYLHSHDTGRYIQPYGHAVPAPNLQRFAEQGILFRQAFCAAPVCSASRASLLTGQCPHRSGMNGLAHRGFSLNDYQQHFLHTLRKAGYFSGLVGLQHIAKDPAVIGYDRVWVLKEKDVETVIPAAVEFLKSSPKQPFFLDVGLFDGHRDFRKVGSSENPNYCLPPAPLPDTPKTREDMAEFKASIRVLDQGYGEVLRALDASGLTENTLVIVTTDHGIAFPTMKCNLTDHGLGVTLMMRGPGGFSGGKVSDAMVSHIDLFPTLCDWLQMEKPSWLEGKSMMPLVRGEKAEINEEIFAEVTYHAAYEPQRAVRTKRWKYIRRYGDRTIPVLPNCDDGLSKDFWLQHGWKNRPIAKEQLYDLIFDPNEACNVAQEPHAQEALQEMRNRLESWMKRTKDPLLQGPFPSPSGARINDPDDEKVSGKVIVVP